MIMWTDSCVPNLWFRLTWSTASTFPLLLFLVTVSSQYRTDCRMRFQYCQRANGSMEWSMECDVLLRESTKKLQVCGGGKRQVTVLDSTAGVAYDEMCDIETCSVKATWCSWGAWSKPLRECGTYEKVTRRRKKCCHPVSEERDARVDCARRTLTVIRGEKERKYLPRTSCRERETIRESEPTPDSSYTRNIIISCSVGLVVIIIIVLCRCSRNLRNRNQASTRRPSSPETRNAQVTRTSPPGASSSPPLMLPENPPPLRVEPGRVIRAPTPPPAYGAPPAYNSAWQSPADADPESPPPQYEAALRLTT